MSWFGKKTIAIVPKQYALEGHDAYYWWQIWSNDKKMFADLLLKSAKLFEEHEKTISLNLARIATLTEERHAATTRIQGLVVERDAWRDKVLRDGGQGPTQQEYDTLHDDRDEWESNAIAWRAETKALDVQLNDACRIVNDLAKLLHLPHVS